MDSVVTRKIPEIVLVDKSELDDMDLYRLNVFYKTDINEFVICPHQRETIYLNKSLRHTEDLITIINEFMEKMYLNSRMDKLYDEFKSIAGEKASGVLMEIWLDWRKERMKAAAKKKAEEALSRVGKRYIKKYMKKREDIIQEAFYIGLGVYEKNTKVDFQKGAESAFIYGYLCALEDVENK